MRETGTMLKIKILINWIKRIAEFVLRNRGIEAKMARKQRLNVFMKVWSD